MFIFHFRSYDEYSQGGGTPYSEGDFESDLHAYRTQRERQRSCSPDQYSDDVYSESYREYKAARYAEYPAGSPGSEPEDGYYEPRDKMYYKERYVAGSREASPEETFPSRRSWSHSPSRSRVKDPERNTPPTPLGGEDTQDFSSQEHSPSEMDGTYSDYKRSGKDDFDITEEDIKELRTSKHSAHRKEALNRSEERYARKRSYEDSFTRDSISKEDANVRKIDRQLSHGSLSDSKRELFNRMKKLQTEGVKSEGQVSSGSSDSGSLTGGDLSKLKHERQMLLEKIKQCEDTNNSDADNLDLEHLKKSKRSRLDPWSKGQGSQRLQSELGNVTLGAKKDKTYDVSQSYRKQMEALRKNEERTVKEDSVKSKKNDIFGYEEQDKDDLLPQGLVSPKDLPLGFVKKRRKTDLSEDIKSRTYRHKRENEDERMSSDNDESAKTVLRTDSVGSMGSIRHLSSAHSSPRTPIAGHLSLENLEHKLSESEQSNPESGSLTFKKIDSSKRRSKDDLHSSPLIIPLGEDVLVTDLHDPRVPKDSHEEEISLPLPKFAEYTPPIKFNSPRSDNSGNVKEDSPCFSPPSSGSKNESPHSSPNDTISEGSGSQTNSNPEQAYIPPEDTSNNSNEPTLEPPEDNAEMEVNKNPQDGEVDDVLSDSSEHDDFSLAERIRQLDEKLKQLPTTQPSKLVTDNIPGASSIGIGITSTATPPSNIYKSKYKIKKKQDSIGIMPEETEKGEKPSSEIVKTMLSRSSIFDLDSKRLEQINEKYSPNVKSVVSGSEDLSKNMTLRTKAEAKEMPLSTLPGSLAGRLGNGGSSFPTLSINTQPLNVKVDDKNSPPLSQEQKAADMCSFNNDNRIYNVTDRMDLSNSVTSNYSPRFNSIDNGLNKMNSSTRTIAESVIESTEKSDSHLVGDSAIKSDPRLNSKNTVYKLDKTADENMDLNNRKLDNCLENKLRHPSPKLTENSKSDVLDLNHGNTSGNKVIKSDSTTENMDTSAPVSLGKRKSELNLKKDKVKSIDNNSPTDSEKDLLKSNVKSGSESPDTKKAKLSTPEKEKSDKSETDSPTHSDSAKTDKMKKDGEKKTKESKKKEKSECDSVNKDKGFNDRKDKDHDGDKGKSSGKASDSDNKVDEKLGKVSPDVLKKDLSASKPENEKPEPQTPSKKDNDKKTEHSSSKKEKKSDSSKNKSESKSDSSHKKDSKGSSENKVKDKSKSSHKTKESSKNKDDKTGTRDGKSASSKVTKTGSTEKVDQSKNSDGKDPKSSESGEKKEAESKTAEKTHDVSKESTSDSTKEKSAETTKKSSSSSSEKTKSGVDKSKSDGSKGTDTKHKKKPESSDQRKSKTESSKKDKLTDKTKHSKPKEKLAESSKAKEKTADSKPTSTEKIAETEGNEMKSLEGVEKTKSTDDSTKVKEKSDNGKQKDKSGNGNSQNSKEKSEYEKSKSSDTAVKSKTKHSDSNHSKSKVKEEKLKSSSLHGDKTKDKSHKDSGKKDDDQSKAESKKENNGENKSSNANSSSTSSSNTNSSKQPSETSNASEKKESNSNGSESKSDSKSENKSENKNDSKSEGSSGNTDSIVKKSDMKKDSSKSSSKTSSKKSTKSESRSSEKKKKDKDREAKKEDKTSPKEKESKKQQQPKKEVEFDWSAWMDEPYTSMYDRVKRKSSEKDKEREMQVMQKKFTTLSKSRGNKKHSKFSDSDDSDFSHDSAEETDAFEEEKVAKPSKEVSSTHDSAHKRKRCVIDTSTSSDDDDSQFYKSFHKNAFGTKDKDKSNGKTNKHSVNDIYSSDSSETDIDFPPISPAKKKTKKTKKTKKPVINHDSDSEDEHTKEKQQKRKAVTTKPKSKNTPKKKSEAKTPQTVITTDTHESDLYDIDSDMDRFDRIKLKNQKKLTQQRTPKRGGRLETTTDDSDVNFSPSRKSLPIKKEAKPVKKNILTDPLFDIDSDSSFPDLSPVKNSIVKKNHTVETKKPTVTVGTGVIAQTIRNEDLGEKRDEGRKKDKVKKKPKKSELKSDTEKKGDGSSKSLFNKVENFVLEPKDKAAKHSKKEGKSSKDLDYLDEEEISQAEKLVNNMSKLEKPSKPESTKLNKSTKHDSEKSSNKGKSPKFEPTFSSEAETDKDVKGTSTLTNHVTKSTNNHKKEVEEKKPEDTKTKTSKPKKKKDSSASIEKIVNDIVDKKDITEANKKLNNKMEAHDIQTKKKSNKTEMEEVVVKKPTSKLDMDDCFMKKHTNRTEKEEAYKLGFGFFNDFPILEDSKLDEINKKNDKKKKKEKEEESKPTKKEPIKQEVRTPKKKDKKKKDEFVIKENGPKLEDLVGKLTSVAHNSDVFDFQDEEDDNKPLFADFFKKKEELNKIAGGKKGDGKNSEKRLSSEEKSDDASSESHEENEEGHKGGHKGKVEKPKCEDKKIDTDKPEDSIKNSFFSPTSDSKLEDPSISSMFSPKHVKEACKDETKNILAFASPKGIDMIKSDDEGCKTGLLSPSKMDLLIPKDRFKKDIIVGHAEVELKGPDIKSKADEKLDGVMKGNEKKVEVFDDKTKPKLDQKETQKNDKKKDDKQEKPEVPEKSREEIVEEAVSALQKISEHSTPKAQEGDTYSEGDLVIDETNVAVETVTEEPVLAEQAQNETDLAILSILPMDGDSHQYTEPIQEQSAVVQASEQAPDQQENVVIDSDQITVDTNPLDSSLGENDLVIDTSAPSDNETPKEEVVVPLPVEKPVEQKEKQPKGRRNQKAKDQADANVQKEAKSTEVKDKQAFNSHPEVQPGLSQPVVQQGFMYGQVTDPKQAIGKIVQDSQKNEPYKKTRKQKAASKANHQVEVPGTFYPPVYNSIDHGGSMVNNIQGGDASEKENEEKMAQPYNSDVDKHEDLDNLRISGDEGSNSADKRTRRGRKQQNYKELNSGVHGRNTSPRSRSSPRSPRTGMSPRQALSPLSSPKSDLSSAPFVKIERLPFGCNKNIRNDGELSNEALEGKIAETVENLAEQHNLANTKKLVEDLVKPPIKEGTSVFDFDDTEPELKIDTTLKPTRQKKGRRNTQDNNLTGKVMTPEVKTPCSQNHMISPLESRWQCKKDNESEKPGNHPPLKLTIALAHSSSLTTSSTNTTSNVINSATIIDSTIPSIKNKKEPETITKPTMPSVTSFVDSIVSMVNKTVPPTTTMAPSVVSKSMSNVDKIIDDVSKGIFDFAKPPQQVEINKEHLVHEMIHGFNLKPVDMGGIPMSMQPSKKRHAAQHNGEQEMMPPPQITPPPSHEFVPPPRSSPNQIQPAVSSPFGSVVMSLPQAQPIHTVPVTTVTSSSVLPVGTTSISTSGLGNYNMLSYFVLNL